MARISKRLDLNRVEDNNTTLRLPRPLKTTSSPTFQYYVIPDPDRGSRSANAVSVGRLALEVRAAQFGVLRIPKRLDLNRVDDDGGGALRMRVVGR